LKYNFYDLLNYLKIIFSEFGENFETKNNNYGFCESGTSYDLLVNNNRIGFFGKLDSKKLQKIPNVKLIKDDIFYCEINLTMINEKIKKFQFESKFPAIVRQYNLVYKKNVLTQKILDIIQNSSEFIQKITICDIYESSENLTDETHSVLFEIKYCSVSATLTSEQIECVEQIFLSEAEKKYNTKLKK
jgi:phenylalanyl-tRNA synthetase beta subunit